MVRILVMPVQLDPSLANVIARDRCRVAVELEKFLAGVSGDYATDCRYIFDIWALSRTLIGLLLRAEEIQMINFYSEISSVNRKIYAFESLELCRIFSRVYTSS